MSSLHYEYMKSYCPYTDHDARRYPALVKTSLALHDSQVKYCGPVKYVARMRTIRAPSVPPVLKVNMNAGHGGASGRYEGGPRGGR